jgi:hypothetical protein
MFSGVVNDVYLMQLFRPRHFLGGWVGTPGLFEIVPLFRSLLSANRSGG